MAKEIRKIIYLFSSSKNGHFYSTTKNRRKHPEKIRLKKFDPFIRKHVLYIEKSGNK